MNPNTAKCQNVLPISKNAAVTNHNLAQDWNYNLIMTILLKTYSFNVKTKLPKPKGDYLFR